MYKTEKRSNFNQRADELNKMTQTIWIMFSAMHQKKKSQITFHQYLTMEKIRICKTCTINDVAQKMNLAQSTASQLIDRLVQAKLVIRETNPKNRRSMIIRLTKEGEKALKKQEENIKKGYEDLLATLPEEDQDKFLKAFRVLCDIGDRISKSENYTRR